MHINQLVIQNELSGKLLESVDIGFICIDADLNIQYANPHASLVLGNALIEGTPLSSVRYFSYFGDLSFVDWVTAKKPDPTEILVRKSPARWMQVSKIDLSDGLIAIRLVDVSDLKKLEQRLIGMVDDAEHESSLSSDFLVSMTHELRTPLHAVLSLSELLVDEVADKSQLDKIKIINSSGRHLLQLINNILDSSRAESGELQLASESFYLDELLTGVVETLSPLAKPKGLSLTITEAPELPFALIGDDVRIKQILMNVVGNALKFTQQGGVSINARLVNEDKQYAHVEIAVSDTGIGVARDKLASIFDRFSQADSGINRKFGGTGLGLSISRDLARAMGGDILVESEFGHGSVFTIDFLLAKGADCPVAQTLQEDAPDAPSLLKDKSILIVDDVEMNLIVTELMLQKLEAKATLATSADHAIEAFKKHAFDVVLMDLQMPQKDGLEATKMIREYEASSGRATTPILALTANDAESVLEKCFAAGMQGCLPKPPSLALLKEVLEQQL